jgi:hypothetical protein
MMQQDGQLMFVVEAASSAVSRVFQLLASHGSITGTSDVHVKNGLAQIEVLAPASLSRAQALEIGAELASISTVRGSELVALHRRAQPGGEGRGFERRMLAGWTRPTCGFRPAEAVTRVAA